MRGTLSVLLLIASTGTVSPGCDGPLIATVGRISSAKDSAHPGAGPVSRGEAGVGVSPDAGGGTMTDGDTLGRDVVQIEPGTRDEFCAGHGPAVRIVSPAIAAGAGPVCRAGVGRRLFSYGLCSCGDALLKSAFSIDSFDSRRAAYVSEKSAVGGASGINGSLVMLGDLFTLGGNVIIAGQGPLTITSSVTFGGDIKTNAALAFNNPFGITIAGNLWANADISASTTSMVQGDLYQTPGHSVGQRVQVAGSVRTMDFVVAPPCPCGADAVLDVAAIVAEAQHVNDNDQLGVSPDALIASLRDAGVDAGVPAQPTCGRVFLGDTAILADGLTTVTQRLALFVHGDLTVGANFAAAFGPTGELDVFVSGNLVLQGPTGHMDHPTALRFYVGGSQPILLGPSLTSHAAQIYAPNAPVLLQGSPLNVFGSIFAARLEAQGTFESLHYDRAVLDLGEACAPGTAAPCDRCSQCPAGLACVDGSCAACRSTADCCDPMACVSGTCQPLLAPGP